MALWIWEMPLKLETWAAPSATRAATQWFWLATCCAVWNNAGLGNGGKSASQSILFHWLMTSQLTKYTKEIQYVTSANYQLTFWCLVATNWPLCCTGSCLRGRIMCSNAVGLKCANKFWICWGKWRDTQASISSYAQLGTLLTFLCCAGPLPSWQNINFFNVCVRSLNVPQMWGYVRMNRYQNN